jgi:hypothetical protein
VSCPLACPVETADQGKCTSLCKHSRQDQPRHCSELSQEMRANTADGFMARDFCNQSEAYCIF